MKKKILVTGSEGLIGKELCSILKQDKNVELYKADLQLGNDLTYKEECLKVCKGMDEIFSLVGIKGSPKRCKEKPDDFFTPMIQFNTNMLEAARKCNVKKYLYTSSIGVYHPAIIFNEEDVWKTFPSKNDKFAGWAKRMGELQIEAYKIQYGWKDICCVRPANVYGLENIPDSDNIMVIQSLIRKALKNNVLEVWGDGSSIRDFVHARDIAHGMVKVMEKMPETPINLGSGIGVKISDIVDIIVNNIGKKIEVKYDTSKPSGDKIRLMNIDKAKALGWEPKISLEEGIKEFIEYTKRNMK